MRRTGVHSWTHVVAGSLIIAGVLTGCGGGGSSNSGSASTTGTSNGSTNAVASSSQPSIQGSAPGTATVGQTYNFQPQASGPGSLSFTISNKPAWATFNASTGQLSGTPSPSDIGTDSNIEISVTDGGTVVALPAFSITVAASGGQQGGAGTVTLAWQAPAQNADGTPLTDLAGYNIYYGTQSQKYTSSIKVSNPDLTTYLVQSLPAGTYYFAVTAYDSTGNEGPSSPEVSAAVN